MLTNAGLEKTNVDFKITASIRMGRIFVDAPLAIHTLERDMDVMVRACIHLYIDH